MQNRRETLKQSVVVAGLLATAGFPQFAHAAFNKAAFDAKSVQLCGNAEGIFATNCNESIDASSFKVGLDALYAAIDFKWVGT